MSVLLVGSLITPGSTSDSDTAQKAPTGDLRGGGIRGGVAEFIDDSGELDTTAIDERFSFFFW